MADRNDDRAVESRRILNRNALQSDPSLAPRLAPGLVRSRQGDEADPVELWGRRIAHVLAMVITAGLLLWLLLTLAGG